METFIVLEENRFDSKSNVPDIPKSNSSNTFHNNNLYFYS